MTFCTKGVMSATLARISTPTMNMKKTPSVKFQSLNSAGGTKGLSAVAVWAMKR